MKWGVRRTPEQLGRHTIKKGTKMRRVTVDANESLSGHKYVTFLPVDRDLYRGSYANRIKENSGKSKSDKVYENTYKLKQDLKIPSRDEVKQVIKDLRDRDKGNKIAIENGKAYCNIFLNQKNGDSYYDELENYFMVKNKQMPDDYDKAHREAVKGTINKFVDRYKNQPIDSLFRDTVTSFGVSESNRSAVINELKKRGYNAMVDEAGVGGNTVWNPREGVEPLIVFDGDSSLKRTKSKEIDGKTSSRAFKRYRDWYVKANENRKEENPW